MTIRSLKNAAVRPSTCTTRARCTNERPPRCASYHEDRTCVRLDAVSDRAVDERRQDVREGGAPRRPQAAPRLARHRRRPAVSCRRHHAATCALSVASSRIDVARVDAECASPQSPRRGSEAAHATTRVTGAPRVAPVTNAALARVTGHAARGGQTQRAGGPGEEESLCQPPLVAYRRPPCCNVAYAATVGVDEGADFT